MNDEPTVFVVDDDSAVRDALSLLLKAEGLRVETFSGSTCFLKANPEDRPGCLLLDVRMPGMSGLELQEILSARGIRLPVIMITGHGDVPMAIRAMKAGAIDFIEKPFNGRALLGRVREALTRDAERRRQCLLRSLIAARLDTLSAREHQVLEGMVAGKYNKIIAQELGISLSTVEAHRKRVMEKLHAHSLSEAIRMLASLNTT